MIRIVLPLLLILLASAPALARPHDDDELERGRKRWEELTEQEREKILKAYERWKQLSDEDRAKRRAAWEKEFEGRSPAEQEEILEKLRKVKERRERESRERWKRWKRDFEAHNQRLEKDLGNNFRSLSKDGRMALLRWSLEKMADTMGERVLGTLTGEEADRIRALPEEERERKLGQLIKKATPEEREKVRTAVIREIKAVFALPSEQRKAKLETMRPRHLSRLDRLKKHLADIGLDDPELLKLLYGVPRHRYTETMAEVDRIAKIEKLPQRKKALEELKERLRREKSSYPNRNRDRHRDRGGLPRWVR